MQYFVDGLNENYANVAMIKTFLMNKTMSREMPRPVVNQFHNVNL